MPKLIQYRGAIYQAVDSNEPDIVELSNPPRYVTVDDLRQYGKDAHEISILMEASKKLPPGFDGMLCTPEHICSTQAEFADEAAAQAVHAQAVAVLNEVAAQHGEFTTQQDGNSTVLTLTQLGVVVRVSWSRVRCMCATPWHVTVGCYRE